MVTALLVGLVVGLGLSVPPGPIAVAVIRKALEGKYREGRQMALSASAMDIVYSLLAAFASSELVAPLIDAILTREWLMLAFQVACIVVLIVLGVIYFRATRREVAGTTRREAAQEARVRRLGITSPIAMGIMIAITNLASPTFLPTLIVVIGYLHTNGWVERAVIDNFAYALGFGAGAAVWFLVILNMLKRFHHRLPTNLIATIYRFAGVTFFVFAAILVYHVIFQTAWDKVW